MYLYDDCYAIAERLTEMKLTKTKQNISKTQLIF